MAQLGWKIFQSMKYWDNPILVHSSFALIVDKIYMVVTQPYKVEYLCKRKYGNCILSYLFSSTHFGDKNAEFCIRLHRCYQIF